MLARLPCADLFHICVGTIKIWKDKAMEIPCKRQLIIIIARGSENEMKNDAETTSGLLDE
jgi:hypothetical protein